MRSNAQIKPEMIHFREFKIVRGQINSPDNFKPKHIKGYHSEVAFDMAFRMDKHLIKAEIQINALTNSAGKNAEEAEGFFHIVFFLEVDNLEDLAELGSDKRMQIHPALANAVASISYSTARGIMLSRFQGTALSGFILPVIDPNALLNIQKENGKIDSDQE
jgi:hypothetical protein